MKKCNVNVKNAVYIFYSHVELSTKDIASLLGIGVTTARKRVAEMRLLMKEKEVFSLTGNGIPTEFAFEFCGLDIADLERRYKRLQKLEKE